MFKTLATQSVSNNISWHQCLRMSMALTFIVNGTGINQCGPLQESMLMLGVVTPHVGHDIFKSPYTHTHNWRFELHTM